MAKVAYDSFTDTNGVALTSHTGETGATWTLRHGTAGAVIHDNRVVLSNGGFWEASGVPASAEYDVYGEFHLVSDNNSSAAALIARFNSAASYATTSCYGVTLSTNGGSATVWRLVSGTYTYMGVVSSSQPAVGASRGITLQVRDAYKRVLVDGVGVYSSADNSITAAGKAALYGTGTTTTTDGLHVDNLIVTDTAAPPAGVGVGLTNSGQKTSSSFTTITTPAVADGAILLAFVSTFHNTRTITAPAGWTQLAHMSTQGTLGVWWRVASGESQGFNFSIGGGNSPSSWTCMELTGIDTGSPFDATANTLTAFSVLYTTPAHAIPSDGSLVVQGFSTGGNRTADMYNDQTQVYDALEVNTGGSTLIVAQRRIEAPRSPSLSVYAGSAGWQGISVVALPSASVGATGTVSAGGATASGQPTSASAGVGAVGSVSAGGALASGLSVSASFGVGASGVVSAGGAIAGGVAASATGGVSATGSVSVGGAVAGGSGVSASSGVGASGVVASGGATASGLVVSAVGGVSSSGSVSPGGAIADGNSAAAVVGGGASGVVSAGGATADGSSVSATGGVGSSATVSVGGAIASGESISATGGIGASGSVFVGGAVADGNDVTGSSPSGQTGVVSAGGAVAGGESVTGGFGVTGSVLPGGSSAGGASVTAIAGSVVTVTPGGALAGGLTVTGIGQSLLPNATFNAEPYPSYSPYSSGSSALSLVSSPVELSTREATNTVAGPYDAFEVDADFTTPPD